MKLVLILFLLIIICISYIIFTEMKLRITEQQRKKFFEMSNYEKHIYARNEVLFDWTCRAVLIIDIIALIFTTYQLFNGNINKFICILFLIIEVLIVKKILKFYYIEC